MFNMLSNLAKATVAVVVTPVAVVADLVTLPASADDGTHPFGYTKGLISQAGKAFDRAVE